MNFKALQMTNLEKLGCLIRKHLFFINHRPSLRRRQLSGIPCHQANIAARRRMNGSIPGDCRARWSERLYFGIDYSTGQEAFTGARRHH